MVSTRCLLAAVLLSVGGTQVTADSILDVGPYGSTLAHSGLTRGYWFTAPIDFTITGLRVPTDVGMERQSIQMIRLERAPGVWQHTHNDHVTLGYWPGVDSTEFVSGRCPVGS